MTRKIILSRYFRPIIVILMFSIVIPSTKGLSGQEVHKNGSSSSIQNVDWKLEDEHFIVTYDLIDQPGDYFVTFSLFKEGDSTFVVHPIIATGDIGNVSSVGRGKKIIWEFRKDLVNGLEPANYSFEVYATRKNTEGGLPWGYVGLGAVAMAGGALIYILTKQGDNGPSGNNSLPGPPLRP